MLRKLRQVLIDRPKCRDFIHWPPAQEASAGILRPSSPTIPLHSYVIRHSGRGRGLFSLVSGVVCHFHLARQYELEPVVDFRHNNCEYKDPLFESNDPGRRTNVWEYYFKPVSRVSIDDAYHSETLLSSMSAFPRGYPMMISYVQELRSISSSIIRPSDDMELEIQEAQRDFFRGKKILGVHYRGYEARRTPRHPLSSTLAQITAAIDRAIEECGFDAIFLVTEDEDHEQKIISRYGKKVICFPHFRTRPPVNSYKINPRPMHKYLLGKEILIDTILLSRCQGLVGTTSNVTEVARSINNGSYEVDYLIENGINVYNQFLARHIWDVKSKLPSRLGGFSKEAIVPFPDPV